jgi:hypothetical protein
MALSASSRAVRRQLRALRSGTPASSTAAAVYASAGRSQLSVGLARRAQSGKAAVAPAAPVAAGRYVSIDVNKDGIAIVRMDAPGEKARFVCADRGSGLGVQRVRISIRHCTQVQAPAWWCIAGKTSQAQGGV